MLKKVFIILQFGEPHEWTQSFIDHVSHLERYGWYFKIITPNDFKSTYNVEIVKMTIEEFNILCEKKLGINPELFITEKGIPSFHVTDLMTGFGVIFEDYIKGFDFWGLIGIDCVVGRLDHFVPDQILMDCDIFSDDINTFNGNFSLLRNEERISELFKLIPGWENAFKQGPCPGCIGDGHHKLYGSDEIIFTEFIRDLATQGLRFKYPKYFIHGHDRLEIHIPSPKLKIEEDNSLFELITDVNPPNWEHQHNNFGHEIAYFHFMKSKKWPL